MSFHFILEIDFVLLEEDSYRWPNELFEPSEESVSPIGDLLSHTKKAKSDAAYKRVIEKLQEIDFLWHLDDDHLQKRGK